MVVLASSPSLQISLDVVHSTFSNERAQKCLRVTCYGSSSSSTPNAYLQDAFDTGYLLAMRGHVCVNGAGSCGCMAALNDGASRGNGHIVGVIHEMWLVDGEDASASSCDQFLGSSPLRDGGAHGVFNSSSAQLTKTPSPPQQYGNPDQAFTEGPIREMLIASGKDLQERKRLLVEKADAILVLPGGPGTWDELWEMACARNIGLTSVPLVIVNTCGYYDPFLQILERAYTDQLTKLKPLEILHFEDTPEAAIRWIETYCTSRGNDSKGIESMVKVLRKNQGTELMRSSSVISSPFSWISSAYRHSSSWICGESYSSRHTASTDENCNLSTQADSVSLMLRSVMCFGTGVIVGSILHALFQRSRRES